MTKAVSRKLEADDRAFQQLADQTIKKDPVRALVELITNSDDSYKRLERYEIENDGKVIITLVRARGFGKFTVTDYAEGMDPEKMDKAVGRFGSDTHGFVAGQGGRSFFGRGLKEAILSMGQGFVRSINNNLYNESLLNINKYEREVPKEAIQLYKDKLGIYSHGLQVELVADRQGIKIPQYETLKRALELHYALRDILSSAKREVVLIEETPEGEIKNESKLSFIEPKGQPIINRTLELCEFENQKALLEIFKSEEQLTGREDNYMRQNGILICSSGAIHEITLFNYDGEELAQNLYGRLTCDYIDNLLRDNQPIIKDSRDGIDWSHPLAIALREFAECEIGKYIAEEKKKSETHEKFVSSDATKRKFKKAIEKLNRIAEIELKDVSKGGEGGEEGSMYPPNGFDFVPNYYHILIGQKSTLTLKMNREMFRKERSLVTISSDSPNIRILTSELEVEEQPGPFITFHAYVEGKQIGGKGRVIAIAGDLTTEAQIHTVAQREKSDKRKRGHHRGMFKEIKYSSSADPNMRVRYDKLNGIITIATSAPSVKLYIGPNGEGQEKPETQVMTAELVTQAVCRELALRRIQSGQETTLGEPEEALNSVYNGLIRRYADVVHSILGPHR